MSSVQTNLLSTFLERFDRSVSKPSAETVYRLIALVLMSLLVVNSLIAYWYPRKDLYPLATISQGVENDNPWTGKLLEIQITLQNTLAVLGAFLYIPFFYGLPKHTESIYTVFVYCSNIFTVEVGLVIISSVLLMLTRYPINGTGLNSKFGYCPLEAETVGVPGSITCSRNWWERVWAVLAETLRNFTDNMNVTASMSGGSHGGQSLGIGLGLLFAVALYAGYMDVY
jgi:hypothetical protein